MNKWSLFIIALIAINGCSKEDELFGTDVEHHFFLENNGATMPIMVKGNTTSKILIITLHGGPGDSGINDFGHTGLFEILEQDYGLVYFDQRCAGTAQGSCNTAEVNVADFVDDIDKLILLLEHRYNADASLFILGHSWGASLALDYLINGQQRHKIKGAIQSNGSHNIIKLSHEQKSSILHYADQQINLGNESADWNEIRSVVVNADPTIEEDRLRILEQSYKTEELFLAVDSINDSFTPATDLGQYLGSLAMISTNALANDNGLLRDLMSYNISDQLGSISTPIALYWGHFDMVHPPTMAHEIHTLLGSSDKELFFFNRSFHSPMGTENSLYQNKVRGFVETWR